MYQYHHKVKLHETDAAGILFFSHQFEMIHDAYESLLEKIGFGRTWLRWLNKIRLRDKK